MWCPTLFHLILKMNVSNFGPLNPHDLKLLGYTTTFLKGMKKRKFGKMKVFWKTLFLPIVTFKEVMWDTASVGPELSPTGT